MGVLKSPNIFQEKISELFKGFNMVHAYIDGVLVISNNEFKDHLNTLEKFLQIIAEAGLKINAVK